MARRFGLRATLALAAGGLVTAAAPANAETIRITADEWCPYNCDAQSDKPGYVVELAKKIYGERGHEVEYVQRPWSRALKQTVTGEFDAAIAVSTEPEGEKMIKPEEPIGYYEVAFYTRAGSDWTYDGVDSLKGKTLTAIQDYAYEPDVDGYIADNADSGDVIVDATPLKLNLRQVKAGRADVTLDDRAVAGYEIKSMNSEEDFRMAGTAGEPLPLYLAFSKQTENGAAYAEMWTEGVRELRANGELQPILDRYGVSDWKK